MGCHSAAGRVARLVERAPSCAHGGGGCWVRVPARLFCARGRRSLPLRTDSPAEGPCVCPNKPRALSRSLCWSRQSQTDRRVSSRPTPTDTARQASRDLLFQTRQSRLHRVPIAHLPICLSAGPNTRPMAADTPDRIDIALLQGLLGVCSARPARPLCPVCANTGPRTWSHSRSRRSSAPRRRWSHAHRPGTHTRWSRRSRTATTTPVT